MKKFLTAAILLLALATQAISQDINNSQELNLNANLKKHEVKLDVAHLIGLTVKADYEYFVNSWSSIGFAGYRNFRKGYVKDGRGSIDPLFRTQVLGFYRLYFGKQSHRGFFLEGHLGVVENMDTDTYSVTNKVYDTYTAPGMGIALGWKFFIPQNNVVFDLYLGIGRAFVEPDMLGTNIYPRVGVCVGKRF